ncbi:MAG TPA: DinB family protein [Candidatus Acidoferrales bacterium]|nr:DinB family protein [Candidatus Acidoferrales bacterium]
MRKRKVSVFLLALGLAAGNFAARAAGAQAGANPVDKTPPSYDMKPQSLEDLDDMHKKFASLAEAFPADQFSWRPAPGVRSVAEICLHVAGENFRYASVLETVPARELPKDYERSTTDKAKIVDQLNQSFDYARAAIDKMANIDFKRPMPKFGPEANAGDMVYIIVMHTHEHLGQMIAYARIKGIVPPWTAAAQMSQKKSQD